MPRRSVGLWFRKEKNGWYVWQERKRVNLFVKGAGNEALAIKAWHRIMAGDNPVKPMATLTPLAPQNAEEAVGEKPTLPALVKAFLTDAEGRVKPESYRGYAKFLNPFATAFKQTPTDRLTVTQVERWSKKPEWSQSYRCGFIGTMVSLFR